MGLIVSPNNENLLHGSGLAASPWVHLSVSSRNFAPALTYHSITGYCHQHGGYQRSTKVYQTPVAILDVLTLFCILKQRHQRRRPFVGILCRQLGSLCWLEFFPENARAQLHSNHHAPTSFPYSLRSCLRRKGACIFPKVHKRWTSHLLPRPYRRIRLVGVHGSSLHLLVLGSRSLSTFLSYRMSQAAPRVYSTSASNICECHSP